MRTIKERTDIEVSVKKDEILNNEWIPFTTVSLKLAELEKVSNAPYKSLRTKLYNARALGKLNMSKIACIDCVNAKDPMKGNASIMLAFVMED